jgi:hypothetical protein
MRKLASQRHHGSGSAGAARENTSGLSGPPSPKKRYGHTGASPHQIPTAGRELSGYFDGQNLPAAIIPTGGACGVATDSATALRTLGQLRGVPAVSGFSRPKSHLGRFSFWYTHLANSSFLGSIHLRPPTHLAGLALFLPSLDAVFLARDKHGSRPNRI